MDVTALPGLAYEEIALHGSLGVTLSDLWQRINNGTPIDSECRNFIWQQLVKMDSLTFYDTVSPIQEPFQNLPKVLYNNERTLAIVESNDNEAPTTAINQLKKGHAWIDVSSVIKADARKGSLSYLEVEAQYGRNLRIVAKHPEVTQLNGVWDPLVPLPVKCSLLVNYLSRQGVEGALSCGATSPLNAAISVKSTTIFHLKKISKLYSLIRWRKILVKKARLSRSTTSGTCAVLPRFVSPSFLLPDRVITLAKQLADYIVKTSPTARTIEIRQCTSALSWSGKKFRSVLNAFPDYFSLGFKKSAIVASESQPTQEVLDESDESKLSAEENKAGQRVYKSVTLQKQMGVPLNVNASRSDFKQTTNDEDDREQENEEGLSIIEDEEDEGSNSIDSNDDLVLGQLYVARSPLRVVWEHIAASGTTGVTLQELRAMPDLGILLSMLRRYIKMLVSAGYIKWANDQLGRQHVKRYFAISVVANLPPERQATLAHVKTEKGISKSRKNESVTEMATSSSSNSPAPSVSLKTSPNKSIFSASLVASARKHVIESCLTDRRALLLSEITAKLRTVDSKVQGSVDRRTVQRLCNELIDEHRVSSFVKPLKISQGNVTVYTAYGVGPEDEAVASAVARRDRCVKPVAVPVSDETELICGPLRVRQVNSGRVTLLCPKLQRAEVFHAFLWYLVFGDGNTSELTGQLAACGAEISKLVQSDDMPPGWVRMSAILDAMPLRLLAFICPVSLAILSPAAVTAAINSSLTFSQLAPDLRASALHTWGSFSLAGELREQMLVLNTLCLVTFLERRSHSTSHLRTCIFVHRATPITPMPFVEGDEQPVEKSSTTTFNCFRDVVTFWSDLRNESILSPASRITPSNKASADGEGKLQEKTKKSRLAELSRLSLNVPSIDAVPAVRQQPIGNRLGPGGSDSRIRLSVSTFWNACKWTQVPRLDEESQGTGLTLRRRTKLMALAGNYRRRRRRDLSAQPGASSGKKKKVAPVDSSSEPGPSTTAKSSSKKAKSASKAQESTRKRPNEANTDCSAKRRKVDALKSKQPGASAAPVVRRRRRVIRQQNIVTHADAPDVAEDNGKVYKTLQNLIDTLAAHDTFYMSTNESNVLPVEGVETGLKPYPERDLATLALLTLHACVTVSASRACLRSPQTPSFQDARRSAVFPSLEVPNRCWVSHAVDMLTQLYPSQKRTSLIFQFVLAAVDLLLNDETTRDLAHHPESAGAMKNLWELIYGKKFKSSDFHREAFKRLHAWSRPPLSRDVPIFPLEQAHAPRLRVISEFWGPNGCDLWSRMGVFLPLDYKSKSDANAVEEENRIRGCIAEQTMCAFLICTRLSQSPQPNEDPLMFDQHVSELMPHIEVGRSAVYNQLVASQCATIQRALARLITSKITKRDFVDSILYSKSKTQHTDEETADAHIGDYSLTSNIRFQIASPHISRCSNLLARIGSFIMKTATTISDSDLLTFDLKTADRSASVSRVFISSVGVVCLTGAISAKSRQFALDVDAVPIHNVVADSGVGGGRKNPDIELSVWPLILKIKRQHLPTFLPIHDVVPQPSCLRYPAKLTGGEGCCSDPFSVPDEVLTIAIRERLPACKAALSDLILTYRVVQKCGVSGCTFQELVTEKCPLLKSTGSLRELVAHLINAELIVRVGYAEERLVTTSIAYSIWLMTSPTMFPWPWSNADGSVNWQALRTLLTSVAFIIIDRPGITDSAISKRLGPSISMVALNRMLQMLEEAGVVRKDKFRIEKKKCVGLFDEPTVVNLVDEITDQPAIGTRTSKVYWIQPDGLMKLGVLTCASVCRQSNAHSHF